MRLDNGIVQIAMALADDDLHGIDGWMIEKQGQRPRQDRLPTNLLILLRNLS